MSPATTWDYFLPIWVALRTELTAYLTGETMDEMIERMLGTPPQNLPHPSDFNWTASQRVIIRLGEGEIQTVTAEAEALGWTIPQYIASLLTKAGDEALEIIKTKTPMKP